MTTAKVLDLQSKIQQYLLQLLSHTGVDSTFQGYIKSGVNKMYPVKYGQFAQVQVGDTITGTGIPAATTITAKTGPTANPYLTLSANATGNSYQTVTINGAVSAGASSITISALTANLSAGAIVWFNGTGLPVRAVLSAPATAGDTTLNVWPVTAAIADTVTGYSVLNYFKCVKTFGTGDGTTKTFTETVTIPTDQGIVKGTIIVTDGVEIFTDDGNGALKTNLAGGTNGTINYVTGAMSVTFKTAVLNTTLITYTGKISAWALYDPTHVNAQILPPGSLVNIYDPATGDGYQVHVVIEKLPRLSN